MRSQIPVRRYAHTVVIPLEGRRAKLYGLYRWLILGIVFASLILVTAVGLACQENPFAEPGTKPQADGRPAPAAAKGPSELPKLDPNLDPSRKLILETLRQNPPKTGAELAQAIRTTLDIEQYPDAQYYLQKLVALGDDDMQLFDLCTEVGSDFFLLLHSEPELQPSGNEYAKKVLTAAQRVANDPARLESLLGKLSDGNLVVRQHAANQLRRLGDPGAVALIEVFKQPERANEFAAVRAALRNFGELALGPLLAAVNANDMQVRFESLLALARIKQPDALHATARALFASDTPASIREAVEKAVTQTYGRVPARDELLGKVYQRANNQLLGRDRTLNQVKLDLNARTADLWRWDYPTRKLVLKKVTPETAGRVMALDRAADLNRIDPQQRDFRQLFLLSYLDTAKRLVGPDEVLNAAGVQAEVGPLTAEELDRVLHVAVDKDLVPAMAGACDLIGELGTAELLLTNTRPTCGLVRAIQTGDRHTQFAALRAISKLDPKQAYAGSSVVLATAVFLAGFGEQPQGLVGHGQILQAREMSLLLGDLGIAARSASTSKEFFREATGDSNLRYFFVCDSLQLPDYLELIQLLRADWRTKRVPIVVFVERDEIKRAERLAEADSRTLVISLTMDKDAMSRLVERMRRTYQPWDVSSEQGDSQSDFAMSWLLKIASDRKAYRFYNLNEHQQDLADMLYASGHSLDAIRLLGQIGTAVAQRNLLSFASEAEFPMELRQEAVRSFELAIQRNGILLTTQEIGLQYDRYEASTAESGESQRVLGRILDLIESQRQRKAGEPQPVPVVGQAGSTK